MRRFIEFLILITVIISCAQKERTNPYDPLSEDFMSFKLNSNKEIVYDNRMLCLFHFNTATSIIYSDSHTESEYYISISNCDFTNGLISKGILFNKTDSKCQIINKHGNFLKIDRVANSYIISFWIKLLNTVRHQYMFVMNGDNSNLGLSIGITNNKIEVAYANFLNPFYSTKTISNSQWYLITCIVDNINRELKLYINGELDITIWKDTTYGNFIPANEYGSTQFFLGKNNSYNTDKYLSGIIDEFCILVNTLLFESQLRAYYEHVSE